MNLLPVAIIISLDLMSSTESPNIALPNFDPLTFGAGEASSDVLVPALEAVEASLSILIPVGLMMLNISGKSRSTVAGSCPWRLLLDKLRLSRKVPSFVVVQVTPCQSHASGSCNHQL